jgi:hypothetical protein
MVVKWWSNGGQMRSNAVKWWSNGGQMVVKWLSSRAVRAVRAPVHGPLWLRPAVRSVVKGSNGQPITKAVKSMVKRRQPAALDQWSNALFDQHLTSGQMRYLTSI